MATTKSRESTAEFDRAEERIQRVLETGQKSLDLSGLHLTLLPSSIGTLTHLERLDVSRNELGELPESIGRLTELQRLDLHKNQLVTVPSSLGQLTKLRRLDLSSNQLQMVPDALQYLSQLERLSLGRNELTAVPDILGQLVQLRELDLCENRMMLIPDAFGQLRHLLTLGLACNRLSAVPDTLGQLTQLQRLHLSNNQLTAVPKTLGQLRRLSRLVLSHNHLAEVPGTLGQLKSLQELHLDNNRLTIVPDTLDQLTQLSQLRLDNNQLTTVPDALRGLTALVQLYLHGNDGLSIPTEVLGPTWHDVTVRKAKAAKPADILDYYFRIRAGRRPLNEAKLILVGRGGVGKTCIIKRLIHGTFDRDEKETPGIEVQPWEVTVPGGDKVRLHVWDFGGQEILHATHQFFLTERTLYLLVLSGREGKPTEDAEYWLQLIRSFGADSSVIVALNKSEEHHFDVNRGLLLEKYPFIVDFVRTDCGIEPDGLGINVLKELILEQTDRLEHRRRSFPEEWFSIKEHLAQMGDRGESFLTWEQFQAICHGRGESDEGAQKSLARSLHVLGIALNYRDDPRLEDTHVLNPRWVTEGIYPLLRVGQKKRQGGVLGLMDLAAALDPIRYPEDSHEFLLTLMEKFELCFPLPDRPGQPKQWLVPELLGENQPDIADLLQERSLGFRYQYQVLPEGVLPRFIVQTRRHSESNPQWRWRTGVVLAWNGCRAVVRGDHRERRVDIHVTGSGQRRRELLAVIREKFEEQHRDLKGVRVEERIIIPDEPDVTASYRHLLRLEQHGEVYVWPEGASKPVRVFELLNGVESPSSRARWRKTQLQGMGGHVFNVSGRATIQTGDGRMENIGRDKNTSIKVGTNYGQVAEVLDDCSNAVDQQGDGEVKELLNHLHADVTAMIGSLPGETARETAENLKLLIDAATPELPKRDWYSVSAAGLLEASKFAKEFTGNIAGTVGQLGKLLWPDFTLPEAKQD